MNALPLQAILGTDKNDPAFCVMADPKFPEDLHVYFGLALIERVNSGPNSFQYKYLVARLYNAGFKRAKLVEAFGHSISTMACGSSRIPSSSISRGSVRR